MASGNAPPYLPTNPHIPVTLTTHLLLTLLALQPHQQDYRTSKRYTPTYSPYYPFPPHFTDTSLYAPKRAHLGRPLNSRNERYTLKTRLRLRRFLGVFTSYTHYISSYLTLTPRSTLSQPPTPSINKRKLNKRQQAPQHNKPHNPNANSPSPSTNSYARSELSPTSNSNRKRNKSITLHLTRVCTPITQAHTTPHYNSRPPSPTLHPKNRRHTQTQ
jgi:hypothetical protein